MNKYNIWISMSDIMMLLMVVFLFILISYIQTVKKQVSECDIFSTVELVDALQDNFLDTDFVKVECNSIFVGGNPDVFFDVGKYKLPDKFREKIETTFEKIVDFLNQRQYSGKAKIEIVGHASKGWESASSKQEAFICNLILSQMRSLEVLTHVLKFVNVDEYPWLLMSMSSRGASSSEPKKSDEASRRIEFVIRLKSDDSGDLKTNSSSLGYTFDKSKLKGAESLLTPQYPDFCMSKE